MGLILSIVIGCLAGFCASKLLKGGGLGFIMNLVLGLFGGLLGGWLFDQLGIQWGGLLGNLVQPSSEPLLFSGLHRSSRSKTLIIRI